MTLLGLASPQAPRQRAMPSGLLFRTGPTAPRISGERNHNGRSIVDGTWCDDPECAERVPNPFGGQDMVREAA